MLLCIAISLIVSAAIGCETDLDCNLGGICIEDTKTCQCSKEWTGDDCGRLNLLPAELDNGFQPPDSSSWGGKVVEDSSGEYHMYVTVMAGKCGLTTWKSNSEVVHAISNDKPTGPYHAVPPGLPIINPFSHNPTVEHVTTESGEKLYVMAHIGCGGDTVTPKQCFNGTTCDFDDAGDVHCKNGEPMPINLDLKAGCDNSHWTGMHTSNVIEGPWTSVTPAGEPLVITNPDPEVDPWHHAGGQFTNPSIWPFDNGAILLAYSIDCHNCEIAPGHKHVGIAYAETWSGPYIDLTPKEPIFAFNSEDPCIFVSPETGTYHLIAHATGNWHGVSAHAFAYEPRGPWIVADTVPYDKTIHWSDGETTTPQKRERPQVIFLNGVPSLLVNGVEPKHKSPFSPNGYTGDWTYTHVQAINT